MRLPILLAAVLTVSVAFAGCDTEADVFAVKVLDNSFDVFESTVGVGDTRKFVNEGDNPHTVTIHVSGDPVTTTAFDVTLQPGDETSFTFERAGTYHIWCRFHGSFGNSGLQGMSVTMTAE